MSSHFYTAVLYKTLAFLGIWVLLSQSYHPLHIALGGAVSLAVAVLNTPSGRSPLMDVRWAGLLTYVPWLLVRIIKSGIHLSALILHPRLPIDPKLVRYRTDLQTQAGVVLLGNSITLTPGTITADVNAAELVVHTMDDSSADDVTSHRMARKIAKSFGIEQGPK